MLRAPTSGVRSPAPDNRRLTTDRPQRRRIAVEPSWAPEGRFGIAELPRDTRNWLLDDDSLTTHLSGMGSFRVQRLFQGWEMPLPSERRLLDQPLRQLALVREVVLLLDGAPVVFARSVFPVTSLGGSLAHLRRLRDSSLGAILFSRPDMRRSPFELALLPGDSEYLPPALRQRAGAWARRSRFEIEGRGLMVSEVFLRAFRPWPAVWPLHRSQRGRVTAAIGRAKQ